MKNNFTIGDSHTSLIACLVDDTLSKNNRMITARQVLAMYTNHDENFYDGVQLKAIPFYHDFREAVSCITEYLNEKNLSLVYANGKNTEDGFMYPQENTSPLEELRVGHTRKLDKRILEEFSKACIGFVPDVMLNHFMEGTMLLLDATNRQKSGKQFVQTGTYTSLENISLLPSLYMAIIEKKVVQFHYRPFNKKDRVITLHPQFLKEYNGRWFVFGFSIDEKGKEYSDSAYALDRVEGELITVNSPYKSQQVGYWVNRFNDIVGVRLPSDDNQVEEILIRTLNAQAHGRIITKPIHRSQREVSSFNDTNGFGEITINVIPNLELLSIVLSHGTNIEIVGNYRQIIAEQIKKMNDIYKK